MIIYKQWDEKGESKLYVLRPGMEPVIGTMACDGWFLFGVIPLYIRKRHA